MCRNHLIYLLFTILTLSYVESAKEPLIDILNNYENLTSISELCSEHLGVLKSALNNDDVWAIKGRTN
jgi:hypothetical protein